MADGNLVTRKKLASFFTGIIGVTGYLGGGWYPTGSRQGVAPFRSVGSDAGPVITPGSAMQLAAVFRCVKLLADVIATLPLSVSQPDANGVLQPMPALQRMLSLVPNSKMTAVDYWRMMIAGLPTWGNSYSEIGRVANRVVSLEPLRPEYMTVFTDDLGTLRYAYANGTKLRVYEADEILHIKAFGLDGLVGLSAIALARQTIGRSIATDQASGTMFLNGLSAGGFIQYAQALKPEQREEIRKNLVRFTGSANMGKVMVLENGMTYEPITMSAKDSQMLETRAWNVEEICRWLDTPPPLIGHTNKASSWASSLENTILWYIKTTVRPTVVAIEQALKRALKLPASTVIEFNMDDLERGDSAARAALYASAAQNGWMDRDEIRDLENLPRRGNGAAQLTVQSNLVPLDKLEELGGKPGNSDKPQPGDSTGGDPGETT